MPSRLPLYPFTKPLWWCWVLFGPSMALLAAFAHRRPAAVEQFYARLLYPWIARSFHLLLGKCPYSVGEILLYTLPMLILGGSLWAYLQCRAGASSLSILCRALASTLAFISVAIGTFVLFWGFNYHRQPLAVQLGWPTGAFARQELESLAHRLRHQLQAAAQATQSVPDLPVEAVFLEAAKGYQRLPAHWTVHHSPLAHPKKMLYPQLLSLSLTSGVFCPWTGEAHVNTDIPSVAWPFVAAHELAHQKGFAREDEANYLAYAVGRQHPHPFFRYSAMLFTFEAVLHKLSPALQEGLEADLPPRVLADRRAMKAWRTRWETPIAHASAQIYHTYLQTQGQEEGLRSYGRFIDLILAEQRVEKATWPQR